jgi:hypothetical protein
MGFKKPTRNSLSPQESIASQGGLMPAVIAACIQIPPPPWPEHPSSTMREFAGLLLAILLLFALVFLALLKAWSRKVIEGPRLRSR